ncbi:hypothetical protein JCM24511_01097 [Saitozyma sp. JCM 24511]|nr:hypothetical protein JCM24511_01097 [Saitozyma sp. JCM 24511]
MVSTPSASASSASASAASASTDLLLFTTSPNPLTLRYPRPYKPVLVLPPLLHRALHAALDQDPPSALLQHQPSPQGRRTLVIPQPDSLLKHDLPLASETDAEVTLKLHLVADGTTEERVAWVEEALRILATHKGLSGADHLLVGFRGVDYKGKKTAASEFFGCGAEGLESGMGSEHVAPETELQVLEIWERLQSLVNDKPEANGNGATTSNGDGDAQIRPHVKDLGTLYFPLALLKRTVDSGAPPSINALDTPDCHHLPKEYTEFAKSAGVELWAGGGGEGAELLPAAELHNLLQEFSSPLSTLLGSGPSSEPSPLSKLIPLREDMLKYETVPPGVAVRWVLGYTVVSKARHLVQDKGSPSEPVAG